jgi:N-acetylmuramoyl-L-alanine amidase
MIPKKSVISFIVVLSISISLLWSGVCAGITSKQAYFEAEACHKRLRNSPAKMKYRENWMDCIEKFQQVYRMEPDGPWAPAGLYMSGKLYGKLAKYSGKQSDQQEALDIYQRIIKRFPDSRYRQKAAAEIQTFSPVGVSEKAPPPKKSVKKSASSDEDTYRKAEACYNSLRQSVAKIKYRQNWMQCIDKFYAIYRKNPDGEQAAAALFMTGKLYSDLYQKSRRKSDLRAAHTMYEKVAINFPDSRYEVKASLLIDEMPQWVKKYSAKKDPKSAEKDSPEMTKAETDAPDRSSSATGR